MTTIALEPITKDYLPKREGTYLVKTLSTCNYPMKKPHFLEARVTLSTDDKGKTHYAIDISNQVALEISTEPIR
jgi:hypothetical protein